MTICAGRLRVLTSSLSELPTLSRLLSLSRLADFPGVPWEDRGNVLTNHRMNNPGNTDGSWGESPLPRVLWNHNFTQHRLKSSSLQCTDWLVQQVREKCESHLGQLYNNQQDKQLVNNATFLFNPHMNSDGWVKLQKRTHPFVYFYYSYMCVYAYMYTETYSLAMC